MCIRRGNLLQTVRKKFRILSAVVGFKGSPDFLTSLGPAPLDVTLSQTLALLVHLAVQETRSK